MRRASYENPTLPDITVPANPEQWTEPRCPVFGECGGCSYQHIPYEEELRLKSEGLRDVLSAALELPDEVFEPMIGSPRTYHSRTRLDLTFLRIRSGDTFVGFMPPGRKRVLPIEACPIAREEISDFIPELHRQARERMPERYRNANLVIKTGDDGRVLWGGIGKGSLKMEEKDYFWTEIRGRKIYYSLETFFQANHSILPQAVEKMAELAQLDKETLFLDLYAGVGLFGICLEPEAGGVVMIEDCTGSVNLAHYNVAQHGLKQTEILRGTVEEHLPEILKRESGRKVTALIDPPRRGLSESVSEVLKNSRTLDRLLYLSCHPESLRRDLSLFHEAGWQIRKIVPMDFFPRTRHLETLVLLTP